MTDEQKAVVSADQRNAVSAKKKGALTGIVDVTDDKVDSGATGDDEDDDSAAPGEEASKSSAGSWQPLISLRPNTLKSIRIQMRTPCKVYIANLECRPIPIGMH